MKTKIEFTVRDESWKLMPKYRLYDEQGGCHGTFKNQAEAEDVMVRMNKLFGGMTREEVVRQLTAND